MTNGFTTELKQKLRDRQRELKAELAQINKALQVFEEPKPQPKSKKRRRIVDRNQVLAIVKQNPGIAATQVAKQMNLPDGTAYSVLNRLKADDLVAKYGTGWYPIEKISEASISP